MCRPSPLRDDNLCGEQFHKKCIVCMHSEQNDGEFHTYVNSVCAEEWAGLRCLAASFELLGSVHDSKNSPPLFVHDRGLRMLSGIDELGKSAYGICCKFGFGSKIRYEVIRRKVLADHRSKPTQKLLHGVFIEGTTVSVPLLTFPLREDERFAVSGNTYIC